MSMKNSSDTIGNRTRDLPTCSAVPQPIALRRAPYTKHHEFGYIPTRSAAVMWPSCVRTGTHLSLWLIASCYSTTQLKLLVQNECISEQSWPNNTVDWLSWLLDLTSVPCRGIKIFIVLSTQTFSGYKPQCTITPLFAFMERYVIQYADNFAFLVYISMLFYVSGKATLYRPGKAPRVPGGWNFHDF